VLINPGTVAQWERFVRAIGREDLVGDERYSSSAGRVSRRAEVNQLVKECLATMEAEEILNKLRNADVPCSPLPSFDQVANDPQLLSREMVIDVDQVVSGKVKVPGSVFKMSKTPGDIKFPAPFLGEYNYEVYRDMLGYSEPEIREFADEGVI
jgi:formyl-CoA transferase